MLMLKLALHRGVEMVALWLLMRGTYPTTFSVLAWIDGLVAMPEATVPAPEAVAVPEGIDPAPPAELPFGPLRPPPQVDWAALPAVVGERIHTLGHAEVIVDRQAFETIVANLPALVSSSAPVPVRKGDRVVGVRLLGVRPDTLLGMLNVENGDVLERVDAYDMVDPDQVLAAYAHLRRARDFSVQLLRRSKRVSVHYAIR